MIWGWDEDIPVASYGLNVEGSQRRNRIIEIGIGIGIEQAQIRIFWKIRMLSDEFGTRRNDECEDRIAQFRDSLFRLSWERRRKR